MMPAIQRDLVDIRVHQIALASAGEPMRQLPFLLACITEVDPIRPIPRLKNILMRYNMEQFDRLTAKGYKLNLLREEYEKVHA